MKVLKKVFIASAISMSAFMIAPKILPSMQSAYTVQAATVRLSETKKTMYKGYTYNLKVKGTSEKVTWTSSDKSMATVNSNGKVYAKKNGKVTITAKVSNKKYTCKVTVKNKPYNLKQFKNTTFYDLKDVAEDYRKVENIKNYKDFSIDLDADGKIEKITVKNIGKNENGAICYQVKLNDKTFAEIEGAWENYVYIADLNKNDNKKEVIIQKTGAGESMDFEVYSKSGTKMKNIGVIVSCYISDYNLKVDQKGKLLISNVITEAFSPKMYSNYYVYNGTKIKEKKADVKSIKNVKFSLKKERLFTSNMKNLEKYHELEGKDGFNYKKALKKAKIYEGKFKNFKVLKITDSGEIYVKLNDGRKGYMFSVAGYLAG